MSAMPCPPCKITNNSPKFIYETIQEQDTMKNITVLTDILS
jgi:hypothetical protein